MVRAAEVYLADVVDEALGVAIPIAALEVARLRVAVRVAADQAGLAAAETDMTRHP